MKVTQWFDSKSKPIRKGLYQTIIGDGSLSKPGESYSYWNGSAWGMEYNDMDRANSERDGRGSQDKRWRGLASKDGK